MQVNNIMMAKSRNVNTAQGLSFLRPFWTAAFRR